MAEQQARKTLDLDLQPATLEGFGPIGPGLLTHLLCGAEVTPFLITTSARTSRFSTSAGPNASPPHDKPKPSHCRQGGTCAAPACWHPISHNHHLTWWSHGGRTDLDNLIGLCRKCHTLVHSGRLELARGSPHQALAA